MSNVKVLVPATPQLLTTGEAAELLKVSSRTILNWINHERIPYVQLPPSGGRNEYRIPLQGLLSSLSGTYDLAGELRRLDQAARADAKGSEDEVLAELDQYDASPEQRQYKTSR